MPDEPNPVEPLKEYLGAVCASCGKTFLLVGPLDPVQVPLDKEIRVGARGPVAADCPHCDHHAEYALDQIRRVRAP